MADQEESKSNVEPQFNVRQTGFHFLVIQRKICIYLVGHWKVRWGRTSQLHNPQLSFTFIQDGSIGENLTSSGSINCVSLGITNPPHRGMVIGKEFIAPLPLESLPVDVNGKSWINNGLFLSMSIYGMGRVWGHQPILSTRGRQCQQEKSRPIRFPS